MSAANKLSQILSKLAVLPGPARRRLLSLMMGQMVPFVGTARLRIEEMTEERVVVVATNKRRIRNHIGQVHAAAMALAAETATGFVAGMNIPDSKLLLLKSMKVDFKKRTQGDIRAEAWLSAEQRERIRSEERGNFPVAVRVSDATGAEPIQCEMIWAWIPKRR